MARPLRIELTGGLYHVTSWGDRREAIYRDDQDPADWLAALGEVCARFKWWCHAYCEMTTHFHLVAETPDAKPSKDMRQFNGVCTMREIAEHFGVHYSTVSRAHAICGAVVGTGGGR